MAIIGPDKRGRYKLRWYDANGRHSEQLPKLPYREVVRRHAAKLANRDKISDEALTFRQLAADYIKTHGPEMAPSALIRANGVLDNHALPAFGNELVNDAKALKRWPRIIKNWRNARGLAGATPATRNREVNVVKAVFYFGVENGAIDQSPLPKGSVKALAVEETAPIFFTPAEYRRFIDGVPNVETWRAYLKTRRRFGVAKIGAIAKVMRGYGAGMKPDSEAADEYRERMLVFRGVWIGILESGGSRLGEILGLRWSQLDMRNDVAVIRQGKTGKPKAIPIAADWKADLETRPRGIGDTLVYTHPDGSPITEAQAGRAFAIWREVAGLRRELTIHKLRHTWASWTTQAGAPDRQVQDGLGHADARMTKRYAHMKPKHLSAAFSAFATMKNSTEAEDDAHTR